MSAPFIGTRHLLRIVLRRDRMRLPLWVAGLGGLIVASALAVPPLYDTPEKIASYAAAMGASPVSHLMSGRQAALDTIGGIVANEISQVAQLGICLMVVFLVVRHTRAEEETGHAELLRSAVLGRHAATLAGFLYGVSAALLIGIITTASMLSVGLDGLGSVAYGVGLALLGLFHVAVALLASQLSTSARGALGLAGAAIAVGYVGRGVAAMQDSPLVWASPFGWAQRMDAFGAERWWPALLLVTSTGALLGLAAWLTIHRDFGGGLLQVRPGPPRAARHLGTPVGMVLRLQRGLLVGWAIGLTALALLYGAVLPTVPDLVASNPDIARPLGASGDAEQAVVEAFLRYVRLFMAVTSTSFVVVSVLRLRVEEESGRLEAVLATGTTRTDWLAATVVVAGAGAVLLTMLMGLGLAVGYGLGSGDWAHVMSYVGDQLSYLPAVLVVAALSVVLVGWWPRASRWGWVAVAFVVLQVMLGDTLRLPDPVDRLSPFWHLAQPAVDPFPVVPVAAEVAVAIALVLLGLWGYRRRDVTS